MSIVDPVPAPVLRRTAVVAAGALVLLAAPTPASGARSAPQSSAGAAAATCTSTRDDVYAGVPRYRGASGAVDARPKGRPARVLTRSSIGAGTATPGDEFGRALAQERTGTGCTILVIGAPGVAGRGAVYVTVDSANGFRRQVTVLGPRGAAGDRFGETLVLSHSALPEDATHYELWVGAPRRDVGSARDAGVVEHFRLTTSATSDAVSVRHIETFRQGANVGSTSEANDRFGEVLGQQIFGVAVGVPHEDVGSRVDAGMVVSIRWADENSYVADRPITQNSPGVAGSAEAGDLFGAAVSQDGLLIGAPGEDVGSVRDAGMVQWMGNEPAGWTQNSPGVPNTAEAGDRFGAAVAGRFPVNAGLQLFIGAPGEDVTGVRDAGTVTMAQLCAEGGEGVCSWSTLRQGGGGIPGARERGDQVGSALVVLQRARDPRFEEVSDSWPLIGAPGEDLGTVRNAGAAFSRRFRTATSQDSFTFSGGRIVGLRYGTVFAPTTFGFLNSEPG